MTFRLMRAMGATSLVLNTPWRRNRLLILAYHGTSILDEHLWSPGLYITPSALRRRMELIREARCNVLPLDTAITQLYGGDLPPRSVAITVDDGTYDFYRMAFPIYEEFGFPVTVYLTTYYMEYNRPVYDTMVPYLLWKGRGRRLRWPEVFGAHEAIDLTDAGQVTARAHLRKYPVEQGLSGAEKDTLLNRLAELLGVDYGSILKQRLLHLINLDEARELAARGVNFQLHTHRHAVSLDKGAFAREIADNRRCLGQIGAGEARHFCYPSGVSRPEFMPWLREWKIASATTCEAGIASRRSDPLLLPRLLDTSTLSDNEFTGWLSGFGALLPVRRTAPNGRFIEENAGGPT